MMFSSYSMEEFQIHGLWWWQVSNKCNVDPMSPFISGLRSYVPNSDVVVPKPQFISPGKNNTVERILSTNTLTLAIRMVRKK